MKQLTKQDEQSILKKLAEQKTKLMTSFKDANNRSILEQHLEAIIFSENDILENHLKQKYNCEDLIFDEIYGNFNDMRDAQHELVRNILDERFPE